MPPWTEIAAIATGAAALATVSLAVATFWMARKTAEAAVATQKDAEASRQAAMATERSAAAAEISAAVASRAQELAIRPLLADPRPADPGAPTDFVQFGAPGRARIAIRPGSFYWKQEESSFQLSISVENVGAGVAVIQGATMQPPAAGDIRVSRKLVPVGTLVRVSASILLGPPESEQFRGQWWAMDGVYVAIEYSDADGGQTLISRAEIRQYATQGPYIERIAIFHKGDVEPIVEGHSSY